MPRSIFFDAFNGVAGDMILGALVDLGVSAEQLVDGLESLGLESFELQTERVLRKGLQGIDVRVVPADASHQGSRDLKQILKLIEKSRLPATVQDWATRIFRRLGEAEAEVHNTPFEEVHFHEVGEIDAIVDVVGSCLGFHLLGVDRFYTSPLALGGGRVRFSHGEWPVPAPATERLIRGFPVQMGPVQSELTTPTGAAIVTTLVEDTGSPPVWSPLGSGFGAGDKTFEAIPNMLRLLLAEIADTARMGSTTQEEITVLEASIDNMEPESLADFQELALSQGALDVYYSSLHMKKGRPGVLLTILCRNEDRDRLARLAFEETTTLGLRWNVCQRWVLERESIEIETSLGKIPVKVGRYEGRIINIWPEYEELRRLATSRGVSLKVARRKVFEAMKELDHE